MLFWLGAVLDMPANRSHIMLTLFESCDTVAGDGQLASLLLSIITVFLTIRKLRAIYFLSVLDKIVDFNYPVLCDDYVYHWVRNIFAMTNRSWNN